MGLRLIIDFIFLLATFTLPAGLVLILSIICLFKFENYYEIIFIGLILDSLYSLSNSTINFAFIYTAVTCLAFLLMVLLKKYLR
jgi:hypothetical protein